ncbi:MAG: DUF565 domain-containing protein [Thermosynechococcaceae cyanobacterium MS004]|nr:DUF565 domain-containing protein [Thermosynechococcaceae cyanobacterium MS004]
MQNTRLNGIVNVLALRLQRQLINPWRRLATLAIALFLGIYLGVALSAVSGQRSESDIGVAALIVAFVEVLSWLFYSDRWKLRKTLWGEAFNTLKLGITYGLFLLAFMLGS